MKTGLLVVLLALLTASCSVNRYAGQRYRAERELWKADWERRNLSIHPGQVDDAQWRALAAKYEAIADRYGKSSGAPGAAGDAAGVGEVRAIAARALFGAIGLHGGLKDSVRVEQIYQRMAQDFGDLPQVAAEVALARGRMSERRGEAGNAADLYQAVVDRVTPRSGAIGIEGSILDLPLRIAQLRSQGSPGGVAADAYAKARAYYEKFAGDDASDSLQCDARIFQAEVASDLREWDRATQILSRLEQQLRSAARPARAPCEIRFAIGGIQSRTGADPELARATLGSLLRDYPDCPFAAQALLVLANNAKQRKQLDEALGYLGRVVKEHAGDQDAASQALLARARLLEEADRWAESLEAYRALAVQFPISKAALLAPLEIAMHYSRAGDTEATTTALQQAERDYRGLIARYPAGSLRLSARQRLVQTLTLQQKYDAAVAELMGMGDELNGTSEGAMLLVAAARMAYVDQKDTTRAITILDRAGELYASASIGRWATGEAQRLRGIMAR